jgi:hypothetical protein
LVLKIKAKSLDNTCAIRYNSRAGCEAGKNLVSSRANEKDHFQGNSQRGGQEPGRTAGHEYSSLIRCCFVSSDALSIGFYLPPNRRHDHSPFHILWVTVVDKMVDKPEQKCLDNGSPPLV